MIPDPLSYLSMDLPPLPAATQKPPGSAAPDPQSWAEHAAGIYGLMLRQFTPGDDPYFSQFKAHAMEICRQFRPRDAIEELTLIQLLWCHARLASLNRSATSKSDIEWFEKLHRAIDSASETYRKHLAALTNYRRPQRRRRRGQRTTIHTANIAAQQIIQSVEKPQKSPQKSPQKLPKPPPQKPVAPPAGLPLTATEQTFSP